MKRVLTTCEFCGCGCNFYLGVEDGKVVAIYPSVSHPISQGRLCIKGWQGHEYIHSPERLTTPLIKKGNRFREASWDEAYELIVDKFNQIRTRYENDSIAVFSSAKCTNEENYLMQKFARACLGTNNVDHCARLCHASTVVGLATTFGSGAMTNSINEIAGAEVIFIIGSNTTEQHPLIGDRVLRAIEKGAKVIVADPRETQLAKLCSLYLMHKPGSDVALLNGMMNAIIAEGLEDKEFIAERTEGFESLKETVADYTPEKSSAITSVPEEKIVEAARIYSRSKKSIIIYSMGITQHTTGVDNVMTTANLAMLTGNVGKEFTGVDPLRGQNNVQGACDVGALPNVFSGYQAVTDEKLRNKFEKAWKVTLPPQPGLTLVEMLNSALEGSLRAMYIMGENPMVSDPDINHVEKSLKALDFLVVQDIFLTETATLADVVLPGVSFAEKDGTFTSTERRIQRVRKAIEPLGDSKPDWKIITELSSRLGYRMDYSSPAEIMDEIAKLTPIYGGVSYSRLESFGLQWPCPSPDHPGTPYLHKGSFTRGLGKFSPADYKTPAELPSHDYPFVLTTGRVGFHYHTGTMTRKDWALEREYPTGYVEVNSQDAKQLGIKNGQTAKVISRRGEISLSLKSVDTIAKGVVFIPFHFAEAAANKLTAANLDPVAKIPEYKVCAVRLEKG
ncbi:MAG: formate dehydrogenase subunit alpha [Chloroflexi bacterium CG15_BIG_FIL_POST_REV_8_21_14_020_46_15]|nr:MAG: formate dehydrogenase subunit alpha [Chloroflexi bacterium CG15_BIG_FIL_POST_REV_8_21_14_020_46_15]